MGAKAEFHTGVPEPVGYCCRLLRKAYRRGASVLCVVDRSHLEVLDRSLWTFEERDFVPHVRWAAASAALRSRTPIWLCDRLPEAGPSGLGREVVVGLGGREPLPAMDDVRLIEVVGSDEDDARRGRDLWRLYQQAGFELVHHRMDEGAP